MATGSAANSSWMAGSPNGCRPMPTRALAAASRPKTSITQISAERSGWSSNPISHIATRHDGSVIARARSSTSP